MGFLVTFSAIQLIVIPSRRYDSSPPSTASTRGEYQSTFTCSTAAYPVCRYYYGNGGDWTNQNSSTASARGNGAAAESSPATAPRHHRGASSGFCYFTSNPEATSHDPSFRQTQRRGGRARQPLADDRSATTECSGAADYGWYYSPSSAASSSLFGNPPPRRTPHQLEEAVMPHRLEEAMMMEVRERAPLLMDDDGDIDNVGAAAVDEAIAWAKERFWSQA
ncbi:uncharacterized protein LOC104581344 [Brachypodium distachyon]|uniref:uncharacterized protein LOC104581344 n=1 Tax=Brachypodium distachyon TaxID=15368 RepID=UPI00052FF3FD|nr:uncharacterized protein LOC104581344 [Brachypodium distachyon]|eukprot:XP_010229448.1 uncharacterized protein LOC104581344 [Brachypodium distachyon]